MYSELLLLVAFCVIVVICAVIIFQYLYWTDATTSRFAPFANMPEISISEQPRFIANHLLSVLTSQRGVDVDQNMIKGTYKRYPINRNMQTDSIVAVEPTLNEYPNFTCWSIEVDPDAWNFVWCDSSSSYFVTTVNLLATPVVCIKGEFPKARYMSYYSYVGIDRSKSGQNLFGQPPTKDSQRTCNASIQDEQNDQACAGLRDYEIEPDAGSVNPFRQPSSDTDNKFYTIFLVSPYYKGKLPTSKNIIPLSIYGAQTAVICYRLYSSFNPKTCASKYYWSNFPFDRRGCPDGQRAYVGTGDGGTADRSLDKPNRECRLGDTVCYNACVADALGHSKVAACHKYVGDNIYCVCQKKSDPCYSEIDAIMKRCTNGTADIDNFCSMRPDTLVSSCVDEIDCSIPNPSYSPDDCKTYVQNAKYQSCVSEKLVNSSNPDCYVYENPNKICNICTESGTCKHDFARMLSDCAKETGFNDGKGLSVDQYCNIKCIGRTPGAAEPAFPYNPQYDFSIQPLECQGACDQRYDCVNGYCIETNTGPFTTADCENKCPLKPKHPTETPAVKESFTSTSASTPAPCAFNPSSPEKCDFSSTSNRWMDIGMYGINSTPASKLFRQGWVDLPQVFFKYSYTNYFVRLNNWNLQSSVLQSLYHTLEPVIADVRRQRPVQPNSVDVQENFSVDNIGDVISDCINYIQTDQDILACVKEAIDYRREHHPHDWDWRRHRNEDCEKWLNKDTNYFTIGTQFPVGKAYPVLEKCRTYKSPAPHCNYWLDLCRCKNNETNTNNCCESTLGNVDCDGNPCFTRWVSDQQNYVGDAKAFTFSANTGSVIPFPNPDSAYLGCCTTLDDKSVYVIWMDIPTTPRTPGYENIRAGNYDLRYFGIGHYFWNMTGLNMRPVLSDLTDSDLVTVRVRYTDEYTHQEIEATRACIVLATIEQYQYLQAFNLWDGNVNWLNWGKLINIQFKNGEDNEWDDYITPDHILPRNKVATDSSFVKTPKQGIILLRQIFASFPEAISNFAIKSSCATDKIRVRDKFEQSNLVKEHEYPRYCNPGPGMVSKYDTKYDPKAPDTVCHAYGFDPCCLSRDVLFFTKNYYPRCEKIRICDIEAEGKTFWHRYLYSSLPYKYDGKPVPPPPTPTPTPTPPPTPTPTPTCEPSPEIEAEAERLFGRYVYSPSSNPNRRHSTLNDRTELLNQCMKRIETLVHKFFKMSRIPFPANTPVTFFQDGRVYPSIVSFTTDLMERHSLPSESIASFNLPLTYGIYRFTVKKALTFYVLLNCHDPTAIRNNLRLIDEMGELTLPEKDCKHPDGKSSDAIRKVVMTMQTNLRDCASPKK